MIRYLTLTEYFWLAEQVTGIDAETLMKTSSSTPTSTTRPPSWSVGWRGTIP